MLESALLGHLVMLHPARITEAELIQELATADSDEIAEQAGVAQTICDLAAIGLIHRQGLFVLPTRAALRSYELWQA